MSKVEDDSVALVVTSPPYFAGKAYEEELGRDGVPGSYLEYLDMLAAVFAECVRVLEPGGRIAVNVANLGRRPYRSLAGDVTGILEQLGLLLRGEVIWWKGRAAGGSCAWGSFQRPANPVLRDITERVVIAGKGRFDRALTPVERAGRGLPSQATITREEFMEATTDLWELSPESAKRVGHPAPFPVELPTRLIELYTYADDVVLDPFMGSGTTAVAALRTDRRFIGYDTDESYCDRARRRIDDEGVRLCTSEVAGGARPAGRVAKEVARELLEASGFTDLRAGVKIPRLGVELDLVARDEDGREWAFTVAGAFTTSRNGLQDGDTLWKVLAQAAVLHQSECPPPLVLLTTSVPTPKSAGAKALAALTGPGRPAYDVIALDVPADRERLRRCASDGPSRR